MSDNTKYVTISAASMMLGVHINTLRNWTNSGKIDYRLSPGGHRLFNLEKLENMLKDVDIKGKEVVEEPLVEKKEGMVFLQDANLGYNIMYNILFRAEHYFDDYYYNIGVLPSPPNIYEFQKLKGKIEKNIFTLGRIENDNVIYDEKCSTYVFSIWDEKVFYCLSALDFFYEEILKKIQEYNKDASHSEEEMLEFAEKIENVELKNDDNYFVGESDEIFTTEEFLKANAVFNSKKPNNDIENLSKIFLQQNYSFSLYKIFKLIEDIYSGVCEDKVLLCINNDRFIAECDKLFIEEEYDFDITTLNLKSKKSFSFIKEDIQDYKVIGPAKIIRSLKNTSIPQKDTEENSFFLNVISQTINQKSLSEDKKIKIIKALLA